MTIKSLFSAIFALSGCVMAFGCSPMAKSPASAQQKVSRSSTIVECQFEFTESSFCGQVSRYQRPYLVGKPMSFRLAFWQRESGSFLGPYSDPGLKPQAWLWMEMPSGGHGSSPISITPAKDSQGNVIPGIYDVGHVLFTMPPRSSDEWWELHLELQQADGTVVDHAVQTIWDFSGA